VGYDEMLRQMLAADELYPSDMNKLRASGFLARQYFKFNRNSWMEETIEHTGKAFLGLTFNWGALIGWAAVMGELGAPALALYAGGIAWTLHYDTIYAHQDKEDDALIGVKSTALKLGGQTKPWLAGFSVATIVLFEIAMALAHLGWPAMLAVAAVTLHLTWQILTVELDDPADCLAKFRSNRWIGWLLVIGIVAGQLLR
jgi:4-hydroxybenzoate polyprenyltransferase